MSVRSLTPLNRREKNALNLITNRSRGSVHPFIYPSFRLTLRSDYSLTPRLTVTKLCMWLVVVKKIMYADISFSNLNNLNVISADKKKKKIVIFLKV